MHVYDDEGITGEIDEVMAKWKFVFNNLFKVMTQMNLILAFTIIS